MTLEEFLTEARGDVERFKTMWLKGDPALYPRDMAPGDWYDQFLAFVTSPENDLDYIPHG